MFKILCGNCCTNQGESSRMYPARQTSSTPWRWSAATTSRSCCSRGLPLEGITSASSPRCRATAIPGASALLEITTAIRASGMRPAAMLSAMATKFDPRPERRIPKECMVDGSFLMVDERLAPTIKKQQFLAVGDFAFALYDSPNGVIFLADTLQHRLGLLEFRGRHYQQHAHSHVEGAQHLFLRDISQLLQMFEDRKYGPGSQLDHRGRTARQHPWQVLGNPAAGDVGQGCHALPVNQFSQHRPVTLVGAHQFIPHLVLDLVHVGLGGITSYFE